METSNGYNQWILREGTGRGGVGPRVTTQGFRYASVKSLPCKSKDLSSDPQHGCKSSGMGSCVCNPLAEEEGPGGSLELISQSM